MKRLKENQKGITLIALIITIIVMLILVGVTVSVALNGGIFGKGEKAAFQTQASTIREQLEIEKASRVMDNNGKPLTDYSVIKIGDLAGIDDKTKEEYKDKIVVDKYGNICYDPAKLTDEEERAWLEEIGIKAYIATNTMETYTFTIGELAERGLIPLTEPESEEEVMFSYEEFFLTTVSEELKNSTITGMLGETEVLTYNITCSNPNYSNIFDLEDQSGPPNTYWLYIMEDSIIFLVINENEEIITMENYTNYSNLTFTISMNEEAGGDDEPSVDELEGIQYDKVYVGKQGSVTVYCIFTNDGTRKIILPNYGDTIQGNQYDFKAEEATYTVEGIPTTFKNRVFTDGRSRGPEENGKYLDGYFSDDFKTYNYLFADGGYDDENYKNLTWTTCKLNTSINASAYLDN